MTTGFLSKKQVCLDGFLNRFLAFFSEWPEEIKLWARFCICNQNESQLKIFNALFAQNILSWRHCVQFVFIVNCFYKEIAITVAYNLVKQSFTKYLHHDFLTPDFVFITKLAEIGPVTWLNI